MYAGETTTSALLERTASRRAEHPFLVQGDRRVSYAGAFDLVASAAAGLESMGVKRGDRVVLHLTNGIEYVIAMLAAHALGAASVHANVLYAPDEMSYLIKDADPAVVITEEALLPKVADGAQGRGLVVVGGAEPNATAWEALVSTAAQGGLPRPGVSPDDPATVIYTSGTTAHPKGVLQRQGTHGFAGEFMIRNAGMRTDDVYLLIMPLFHSNAVNMGLSPMLVAGGTIVISPFSASGFEHDIVHFGATVTSGGAPHWRMVLAQAGDDAGAPVAGSRLRIALSGMPLTDAEYCAFESRFGCRLIELFGQTEALVPPTMRPPAGHHKWRSGGQAALGSELRIWTEDGRAAEPGEAGEIQYRIAGDGGRFIGYLNQPEETAKVITDDGWNRSLDLGYLDEEGFLFFVDRLKDMLKVGGENVAASEVERVLNEHPDVAESAVVGTPDPMLGHRVKAFVVGTEGANVDPVAIRSFCAARLAKFKVPAEVVAIAALPRTATGKIAKYLLPEAPA